MSEKERKEFFKERAGTDDARYHVVPFDEEWAVKEEGKDEPEYTTDSKDEAIEKAIELAEENDTIAYVHSYSGEIEEQYDYETK